MHRPLTISIPCNRPLFWKPKRKRDFSAKSPLGVPWIEPEAIAPAVVFLASDEAYMVSGATYDVTGGDSANYTA